MSGSSAHAWSATLFLDRELLRRVDDRTKVAVARQVLKALGENALASIESNGGGLGGFVERLGFGHIEEFRPWGQPLANALFKPVSFEPIPPDWFRSLL